MKRLERELERLRRPWSRLISDRVVESMRVSDLGIDFVFLCKL